MKAKQLFCASAVLFAFFIQGFCDIVGISSEYAREAFGWSHTMAGFLPSMVFVWFLFVSIPVGIKMNKWGRKNTVLIGMAVTVAGMLVPLVGSAWACLVGYAALGIGNTVLQVSQNALVRNVFTDEKLLTSSLTAGQVVKAVSSFCGPFLMLFAVAIDVGTNFVSSKVMIDRFGWDVTEAGVAPQVYFICRTVGAFLGVFVMTRVSSVTYFRWNIVACIAVILALALCPLGTSATLALIGAVGFLCSCVFPTIYSAAVQQAPDKANLISGLMITAVAGGGAATPLIGWATDSFGSITAGVCVLLLCAGYLTYCAFLCKK